MIKAGSIFVQRAMRPDCKRGQNFLICNKFVKNVELAKNSLRHYGTKTVISLCPLALN